MKTKDLTSKHSKVNTLTFLLLITFVCIPIATFPQEINRLSTIYLDAIADEMFDEADQIAKQMIEESIQTYGIDSHESASAMINLGMAQHGQEDFESAITNYETAIDIIERIENHLDKTLINPLKGLAEAQLSINRADLAENSYNRAIHISHVNDGPHNLQQLENLQSLADVYASSNEPKRAADVEKRIYYLQSRNIDPDSLEMIPALETLAKSQRKALQYEKERRTWRKIIRITETHKGKESLDLIKPLTELGRSYIFIHFATMAYDDPPVVSKGDSYLKKAIRITEENPDTSWLQIVEAKMNLADYYILSDRANRSYKLYRIIWDLLSEDKIKLEYRAVSLEIPVILERINPPIYFEDSSTSTQTETPSEYKEAFVSFNFNVTKRGLARNINRASFNPDGLDAMHKVIGNNIRHLVYRPKFKNRDPVIAQNVSYKHQFFYKQNETSDQAGSDDLSDEK